MHGSRHALSASSATRRSTAGGRGCGREGPPPREPPPTARYQRGTVLNALDGGSVVKWSGPRAEPAFLRVRGAARHSRRRVAHGAVGWSGWPPGSSFAATAPNCAVAILAAAAPPSCVCTGWLGTPASGLIPRRRAGRAGARSRPAHPAMVRSLADPVRLARARSTVLHDRRARAPSLDRRARAPPRRPLARV